MRTVNFPLDQELFENSMSTLFKQLAPMGKELTLISDRLDDLKSLVQTLVELQEKQNEILDQRLREQD